MAKINWTHEALKWLEDIHGYISTDNPEAANRTIEGIYNKVLVLQGFPEIGFPYQQLSDRNVRILLYGHYRIAYLIKPNNDIDILGVFHGALDISNYLF